jgi:hypothetical protein
MLEIGAFLFGLWLVFMTGGLMIVSAYALWDCLRAMFKREW